MGRPKKFPNPITRSFYVNADTYFKAKKLIESKLGKYIGDAMHEWFLEMIAKLEGKTDVNDILNYEGMKKEYANLVEEIKKLTNTLYKEEIYPELKATAQELGLDFQELSNVSEVSAKLLDTWEGRPEHAHIFISLLEAAQRKKQLEKKLTEIRRARYFSAEATANVEADTIQET